MRWFKILFSAFLLELAAYGGKTDGSQLFTENCTEEVAVEDTGRIILEFKNLCEIHNITIAAKNETSLLQLKAAIENVEEGAAHGSAESDIAVEVNFFEEIFGSNGKKSVLPLAKWNIRQSLHQNDSLNNRSYLSRSGRVEIEMQVKGDRRYRRIELFFKEIKYNEIEIDYSDLSGEIVSSTTFEGQYRPNTITVYRLLEVPSSGKIHILISLERFDLDIEAGEYILIGAGPEPFEGPKPLFISQPGNGSTYLVHNSSAYILFVTRSTQTKRSGFAIRWEHTGASIPVKDDYGEDTQDALKSRDICFYNVSEEECRNRNTDDGLLHDFKQNFLLVVKEYAEAEKISYIENYKRLNASSVTLYGLDDCETRPLMAIVQIKDQGKSLLSWKQLGDVIESFKQKFPHFQADHCPTIFASGNRKWDFLIYLSVPVFAIFLLVVWAWKQRIFEQNCSTETEKTLLFNESQDVSAVLNLHSERATTPKVVETSEKGRRRTLVAVNSAPADVEMNTRRGREHNFVPTPSTSLEPVSKQLNIPKTKRRPSIQNLLDQEAQFLLSQAQKIQKNENEHLYDSVSSQSSLKETKL